MTRARILEAATEEFVTCGPPHARIEDIAERAGANRRMIYYYFGSKDGLYLEALEGVYAQLVEEERKIDVEKLDPVEAIAELVRLKIDHYIQLPELHHVPEHGKPVSGAPPQDVQADRGIQDPLHAHHRARLRARPARWTVPEGR